LPPTDFHCINLDRDGDVLRVTIDHPDSKINAVDDDLHHDLTRLFRVLKQEDEARAILLKGCKGVFSPFEQLRAGCRLRLRRARSGSGRVGPCDPGTPRN
jgi:enoyl-CoA hydratase/carnithine racemase